MFWVTSPPNHFYNNHAGMGFYFILFYFICFYFILFYFICFFDVFFLLTLQHDTHYVHISRLH